MIHDLLSSVDSYLRLVFVRHSQDSGTIDGDVVRELSDIGIIQAEKCALFLKPYFFDQLYTSDHLRAQQTMGIIDLSLEREVIVTRKLREVSPFYAMGEIELTGGEGQPVKDFLKALVKNSHEEGSIILAVGHYHLIRYILSLRSISDESLTRRTLSELTEEGLVEKGTTNVAIANTSLNVIDITKSGLVIPRLINYTDHLN